MNRLRDLLQENAGNRSNTEYLKRLINSYAEDNSVSTEIDGTDVFFYGLDEKNVDYVENNILTHLIKECPEFFKKKTASTTKKPASTAENPASTTKKTVVTKKKL